MTEFSSTLEQPSPYLEVRRLGRRPFRDVYVLQKQLLDLRVAGSIGDQVVFCEHEPVYTAGRGTGIESLGDPPVEVVEIERGGEATYHGPGQLVVYPILNLAEGRRDLHRYLRDLEEVVIRVLAEVEVEGRRADGYTGVWVGDKKICSIGVAVRRWVTYHGFALNVATDMTAFERFQPCGLSANVMTRLIDHADIPPNTLLTEVLAIKHLCEVFELELPPVSEGPGGLASFAPMEERNEPTEDAGPGCGPALPVWPR